MEYIQEVTFELNTLQAPVIIGAKQYDTDTRGIKVRYTKNGEPYNVHENNIIRLRIRKPDNKSIFNNAQNNGDGTVTVIFSYECLSAAGRAYADLMEFDLQGRILSTFSFWIDIQPAPNISIQEAISSNEFQALVDFLNQGDIVIGKAQEWANGYNGTDPLGPSSSDDEPGSDNNAKYWAQYAETKGTEKVKDAEAWANGTRNNTVISSTDPAYNKNSKYWANQANLNGEAWANGTRNDIDIGQEDPAYNKNSKYWAERIKTIVENISMSYRSSDGHLLMIIDDLY